MKRDWKTVAIAIGSLMILAACTQPTAPAREDTSCRGSGVSISSGRSCP